MPDATSGYIDMSAPTGRVTYRVEVTLGTANYSNEASVTVDEAATVPDAPAKPEVEIVSGKAVITWVAPNNNNSPITRYKIQRSERVGGKGDWVTSLMVPLGTAVTHTDPTDLVAGNEYRYSVLATNGEGDSEFSPESNVVTLPPTLAKPEAPRNLRGSPDAEGDESTSIFLEWDRPVVTREKPITAYVIQYSKMADFSSPMSVSRNVSEFPDINDGADLIYVLPGLTACTEYHIRIRSENSVGISDDPSNAIAVTTWEGDDDNTCAGTRPGAVTDLAGEPTQQPPDGIITLTWTKASDATGYFIEYLDCEDGTDWYVTANTGDVATYRDEKPCNGTAGGRMHYRVAGRNDVGTGPSDSIIVRLKVPSVVQAPTDFAFELKGTEAPDNEIATFTWEKPAAGGEPSRYVVQSNVKLSGANDASWEDVKEVLAPATTAVDVPISRDTTKIYHVIAANIRGEGEPSNSVTIEKLGGETPTGVPGAPRNLKAVAQDSTAITLTWEAPADTGTAKVTDYLIEESANGTSRWDSLARTSKLTYEDTDLKPKTTVHYRIFAINTVGKGPASNVDDATTGGGGTKPEEEKPSAPTGLAATVVATGISLAWKEPADTGSARITSYKIQQSPDASAGWVDLNTTTDLSYLHTNPTPGATTYYRVFATNKHGDSPASNTANAIAPSDKPGAPTSLSATPSAEGITLTWQAPADTGAAAITGYRVQQSADGGTSWSGLTTVEATVTTYLHTGVKPSTTVHYRVFATNKHGDSPASNVANAMTGRDIPSAPKSLTVQAVSGGNRLTWTVPDDTGSAPITGYRVEQSTDGGSSWTTIVLAGDDAKGYLHRSPPPGQTIHYRVFAINTHGDSPASNIVSIATAAKPPGRPTNVRATATGSTVLLSWSAPTYTGGAAVSGYRVEVADAATANWVVLVENTESTETSYSHRANPGTTQSYRVFAINSAGRSPSSNVVRVNIDAAVPNAPDGVGALAQSHDAIGIAWNPPTNTGGSPITAYRIETSADGAFWSVLISNFTATSTAYRHTGLQPARQYYYRVFAINKAGRSPPSEVVTATTHADLPGVPERLAAAVISPTQINLTWTAPRYTGGVELTGFDVETSSDGDGWSTVAETAGDETSFQHRGLTPATIYHYRVSAKNSVGSSPVSRAIFAQTTAALPDAPSNLTATARSPTEIYLTWMKPHFDGGSRIKGYQIEVSENEGESWSTVRANTGSSSTIFTHTGLTRATIYQYRVAAINKIGSGEKSEIAEAKTFAVVPSPPLDLEAEVFSSTQIDLSWVAPDDDGGAPITRYRIDISADQIEWERLADVDRGLEYPHTKVTPGQTWHYRVSAKNEAGYSEPSNIATATTDDPFQRAERVITAILPRFAVTAVSSSLRAITARIDLIANGREGESTVNVLGGRLGELRGIANGSAYSGTSVWASADLTGLAETGTVDWGGDVFSIHAGLDGMLRDGILVGLAGSRSEGGFNFTDRMGAVGVDGEFDAKLTSMNPYIAWIREDVGLWMAAGAGWGSMELRDPVADRESAFTSSMFAVGGFRHIITGPIGSFRLRAEGMSSRVELAGNVPSHIRSGDEPDDINSDDLRLRRSRIMFEWTMPRRMYGEYQADFNFQGGVRYDYTELETGVGGTELGAGVKLTGSIFRAHGIARMFIHPEFREWGLQGLIELRSRQETGLRFQIRPSYGAAQSGIDQLWERGVQDRFATAGVGRLSAVLESHSEYAPYTRINFRGKRADIQAGLAFRFSDVLNMKLEAAYHDDKPGLSLRAGSFH